MNTLQVDMAGDENPLRFSVLCLSIFTTTVYSYHWNDNTTINPEQYLLSEDYSDLDSEDVLTRYKRSGYSHKTSDNMYFKYLLILFHLVNTPSEWNDTTLTLAIGTEVAAKASLGDMYDFTLKIEMPAVAVASPMSVLVSGTHPDPASATSSVHICSPKIRTIVSNHCYIISF